MREPDTWAHQPARAAPGSGMAAVAAVLIIGGGLGGCAAGVAIGWFLRGLVGR